MKFKLLTYSVLINVILIVTLSLNYRELSHMRTSYKRVMHARNQFSNSNVELKKINGKLVGQNKVLELKINELNVLIPKLHKEIESLGVNPKRATSLSETSFTMETHIQTVIQDSTVIDTIPIKHFHYQDEFFCINGFASNNSQQLSISYQDTLIQTIYRGKRKKPWLWIFSPRQLEQRVALKNPNATINYTHHINIIK